MTKGLRSLSNSLKVSLLGRSTFGELDVFGEHGIQKFRQEHFIDFAIVFPDCIFDGFGGTDEGDLGDEHRVVLVEEVPGSFQNVGFFEGFCHTEAT